MTDVSVSLSKGKFVQKEAGYQVEVHPQSQRLYHIKLEADFTKEFFSRVKDIDVQRLSYVSFERYDIANTMQEVFGRKLAQTADAILHDRESGGFTVGVQDVTTDKDDYVKFGTALTHLIGNPLFDAMSQDYYATFAVQHTDSSDTYLRQAYKRMTLHTDGAYEPQIVDWILMMKFEEKHAAGGNSRLLHLDEWQDLEKYSKDPIASIKIERKGAKSKNMPNPQLRPTFFHENGHPCIVFAEQNMKPKFVNEGVYLKKVSKSLEESPNVLPLELPVGELVMLNNLFWLHGREAFVEHPDLYRQLMRQRGYFHNKPQ